MAIDMSTVVYLPQYNTFGRPVTFTPLASQPLAPAFLARGIFDTTSIDVTAEDGSTFSDSVAILDVLEREFDVVPQQGDHVDIPAVGTIPAVGSFAVIDTKSNGGGETSLTLRRLVPTKP